MFYFKVESKEFKGKTKVEQHRMVVKLLEEELKGVHGYNLVTTVPKDS